MAIFKPFRALRPNKKYAAEILCPPYDVVSREEAARISASSPRSFMHIIRADGSLLQESQYSDKIYETSKKALIDFESNGFMFQDNTPSYYIYSQTMNGRTQTGIVGCASIDDYENGVIKRHEITRSEKEQDRIRHFDMCSANTEPVFLIYDNNKKIQNLTDSIINSYEPEYDTEDAEGVRHRLWRVLDNDAAAEYEALFAEMPALYIADGHHRTASAVKVGKMRREQNPGCDGTEEFNRFMSVAFPENSLKILGYHRLISDLNGFTAETFLKKLGELCYIADCQTPDFLPDKKHTCTMYLSNKWYTISFKPELLKSDNPADSLDASILQNCVLGPLLGITDPRTDKRISFLGGIKSSEELKKQVDSDIKAVAFALYPVSVKEIMSVADAGLVMPPKSTWFEPKLGSGWFVHKL
ncbi:MAG: DUF1015 domain-containing protein [Firmicutes bacterium]|nr:DUF1015 domain-containing protein [Bacillota bacterium]